MSTKDRSVLCDQMKMVLGANLMYANRKMNAIARMCILSPETFVSGYCSTVAVSSPADIEVDCW